MYSLKKTFVKTNGKTTQKTRQKAKTQKNCEIAYCLKKHISTCNDPFSKSPTNLNLLCIIARYCVGLSEKGWDFFWTFFVCHFVTFAHNRNPKKDNKKIDINA